MEEIKNSNEEINRKLREHFDGKIVRKDLTLSIKEGANVPVYVLEFLLGQYCSSEDENIIEEGVQTVKKILSDNFVRPDEAQKILSQLRKNGAYTVIDKVTVKLNIKKDRYEAEFSNLGLTEIVISPAFPEKYDRLLCGGIWCIVQLEYDNDLYEDAAQDLKKKKGNDVLPISIKQLTPIQMPHIEISELKEGRKAFTKDEWISVILRSVGMEPDKLSYREKWLILTRIIPLVENNFNLCELGPRSTGKSHLYKEVSPNSILVSGGQSTVANLFYNMSQRTVGLVGMWDCVAFDEVAGIKFKDKDGIQIMKDYMASGSFARGKEEKSASASMVFVGNINQDVEVLLKTSSLFDPFPPEMGTDTAFLDRIHCYLPGWEIPKFRPEHNNDVRAYRARNAYGDYVRKQKRNARESGIDRLAGTAQTVGEISRGEYGKLMTDAVVGSLAGEEAQNVINGIGTVGQAVSGSDSVGSTVLDVSSTLAAIEAKKLVKKLAETDIKKKKRAEERMKNHGNRFGIDKYDEVTGKNEKSKDTKKNADRHSEAPDKKQGSNKVGSSHKLQQEKQEYAKTQRAKEIKGKQKEIFIKENRKISNTLYSAASGKSQIFRRIFAKKGASLIVGGGVGAVVIPIFLVIIVFILMLAFFGWLSPFSYGLAGEDPDTEHNAETKAEVIDGYALMVKNYMDVTQAYYYLNYGDWYGGTYQYESAELDFASFFADYCESIVAEIQAYYQPLIEQASSPAQAMAISRAMSEAIRQALANAQTAAYQEYSQLISSLDDEFTPTEHRQHYEVEVTSGGNGIDDSADFHNKPIPGTNNFGNVEINSELSAEELLAYIALYKSLITLNPDDTPADPDAEDEEVSVNITPQDIMDFFEETEFFSITTEITHDNPCINQNCKRRLIGDAESGYSWEYYCDSDHDNLTGEIGACLTADELLAKVMELTGSEDLGVDEDACKELIESYLDMFKKELNIDEDDFRKFGAADNEKAQEFYQLLITDELPNADLWKVDTPFSDDEE